MVVRRREQLQGIEVGLEAFGFVVVVRLED